MYPERLDDLLRNLRDDAKLLREVAIQIRAEPERVTFVGPRADLAFEELRQRADAVEEQAEALEDVAREVDAMQGALEAEVVYLRRCWHAAEIFFRTVEQKVNRDWDDYQQAIIGLPPGETIDPPQDPATLYSGWRYHPATRRAPSNLPHFPDQQWREAASFLSRMSGYAGVEYGPVSP